MPSRQFIKDAVYDAMKDLTFYSYTEGWLLSRTIAPTVSIHISKRISSKSVAKYLQLLEVDGYVEKTLWKPKLKLHKWRRKDWEKWTPENCSAE